MDILLISPVYSDNKSYFPWSTLSIGSYLTNVKNYEVVLLDASVYPKAEFLQKLRYFCKYIKLVGISTMSVDAYFVKNTVDYIKEINPNLKIIVGGPHAMLQPEQTCLYKNIDFVAYAEGEHTISLLYEQINSGNNAYDKIPGLIYKDGNIIKRTPPPELTNFYDTNYDLLPECTKSIFPEYVQVLAGRGCSYKCTFCFNSVCGQKWRGRPMIEVINEIEKIINRYNTKVIYFRDEDFFQSKERIREFIIHYKERKFNFRWRANFRASYYNESYVNLNLLKELESINCEKLKIGLESGSQRILNYLKKGIRVENVNKLICALSEVKKINPSYSFMIGIPGETFEEYKQTMDLIKFIIKHDVDATIIGPQYFRVYPGGQLYEEIKERYDYYEPRSFEEWSLRHNPIADPYGFGKNIRYPWISRKYISLIQCADTLVFLYREDINIKNLLKIKCFRKLFFILLAKIRVKYEWYTYLYDVKFFIFFAKVKKRFSNCFYSE